MVYFCGLRWLRLGSTDKPVPAAGVVECYSSSASISILNLFFGEAKPITDGHECGLTAYVLSQECGQRMQRDAFPRI